MATDTTGFLGIYNTIRTTFFTVTGNLCSFKVGSFLLKTEPILDKKSFPVLFFDTFKLDKILVSIETLLKFIIKSHCMVIRGENLGGANQTD